MLILMICADVIVLMKSTHMKMRNFVLLIACFIIRDAQKRIAQIYDLKAFVHVKKVR